MAATVRSWLPVALARIGRRGTDRLSVSTTFRKAAPAFAISGEWAARGMVRISARRAPAASASRSASCTAGISPESTNWTSALRFAMYSLPSRPALARISSTLGCSRPTMAIIAPGSSSAARLMISPRSFTNSSAVSQLIAPLAARAVNSPSEWPAITLTWSMPYDSCQTS